MTYIPRGRFAPTPSGRMHLGNVYCALIAWLSASHGGGESILRIEDLDASRCAFGNNAEVLMEDLHWLGLSYCGGYRKEEYQSARFAVYQEYFQILQEKGLLYPCYCSRAELHAATAPHATDGRVLYDGRCRRLFDSGAKPPVGKIPAYRIRVPEEEIRFTDGVQGDYTANLARDCTDFVIRRSDGVYAYHLAVVVDDALSGVTEVVRGQDLLSCTPQQIYLYRVLGFPAPHYYHIPLLLAADGRRLSKRDGDLDMGAFRKCLPGPEPLLGFLGYTAGLLDRPEPISLSELSSCFSWDKVKKTDILLDAEKLQAILK